MSTLVKGRPEMTLSSRMAELSDVVESMQITDRSGTAQETETAIAKLVDQIEELGKRGGRLYLIGNGGSAGIASHAVTDFLKFGRLRAMTVHDSALFTCMSNDYGYDVAFARILEVVATAEDILVAISSSGQSLNIRNAAEQMRELGGSVLTLSGFKSDNPLRTLGDTNIWLNSTDYGIVEIGHQCALHNVADRIRVRREQ